MSYAVKEIFYTLQGEGSNAGRAAVFCRFSGCNLWTGREADRAHATCRFCDTDFVGTDGTLGGKYGTAEILAGVIAEQWPNASSDHRFVVLTGGEPLLQIDDDLIRALKRLGFLVAVETNGTLAPPRHLDWICVSPKAGTDLVLRNGNELKLVFPQAALDPAKYVELPFDHYYLQPMDGVDLQANTAAAIRYCMEHPKWRLSIQTHKVIGIR